MVYSVTPISAEEINIVGTGAGMSLLEALVKAFNKVAPNVTVSVQKGIGSGGGIKAVGAQTRLSSVEYQGRSRVMKRNIN